MFRFNTDYLFKGKHAQYVKDLTEPISISKDETSKIFNRNLDVLVLAPIIGFLNKRLVEDEKDSLNNSLKVTINFSQLSTERNKLLAIYRAIMLEDVEYEKNYEKRVEKAFKFNDFPSDEKDLERFERYILGGVEILREQIIGNSKNIEDYILNLVTFVSEFKAENIELDELEEIEELEIEE